MYTWEIDPVIEENTAPWQLNETAREHYVVAIALSYAQNQDVGLAFDRLRAVSPDRDVWNMVADIACERVKTVQTNNNRDIRVIRALEQLYRPQGASGCADGLFPTPAPMAFNPPTPTLTRTPTVTPAASKTPSPAFPTSPPQQVFVPTPTPRPSGGYILGRLRSFCDPDFDGIIAVRVYDRLGQGVPGMPVTVTWGGSLSDTFYTGLKPEIGPEYADFEMEPGRSYSVAIPGLSSDAPTVEASACETTINGQDVTGTTSYRIDFQQQTQ
ncbi:MAG: hypothetical protein JXQ72_09730 [Anaerolineae bacterium]|nr:hypothetical protein [Anaerolineae bacterium]